MFRDQTHKSGECDMKKSTGFLSIMFLVGVLCARGGEEFGGLGIEVPSGNGVVTAEKPYIIVGVYEGGAGHAAGLMPGDIIESVDGKSLVNMKHDDVVNTLLRGRVGTEVVLAVRRNNKPMVFRVVRKKVIVERE